MHMALHQKIAENGHVFIVKIAKVFTLVAPEQLKCCWEMRNNF